MVLQKLLHPLLFADLRVRLAIASNFFKFRQLKKEGFFLYELVAILRLETAVSHSSSHHGAGRVERLEVGFW